MKERQWILDGDDWVCIKVDVSWTKEMELKLLAKQESKTKLTNEELIN